MAPQATSATIVIFALVLNTLTAPETRLMVMESLGSSCLSGHLPSLPPVGSCSGSGVVVNVTGSPPLLLVLVSLPGEGNQSVCRPWNYTDVNPRIHRPPPLPLEPGIYGGAPGVQDNPLRAPADFCCEYNDTCAFLVIGYQSSEWGEFPRRRSTGRHKPLPPCVTFAGGHRKLLSSPHSQDSSTRRRNRRRRQHVLLQEPRVGVVVSRAAAAAAALALFGLLCTIAGIVLWCMRNKNKKLIQQIELCPSAPRRYSRRELTAATHGFAEAAKIGRGGFGTVYRGFLADQKRHVAIKGLSSSVQAQGVREFQAEVKVMTRLRHRNIVQLLGWSGDAGGSLMLVYELVPNGSLDKHLHDPQTGLAWTDRYKIALGVGSAILYLHTECEQCVLHGDIKPANILLDASCNAKLGDFGLARLVDHGTDLHTTQVVAGTPGYMDPELVNNGRPSAEADVFSFGVVLLELACGRRPTAAEPPNATPVKLIDWVCDMYHKGTVLGAADRRLDGEFDEQQMRRVLVAGLWCTHHDQSQRPPIAQALDLLRRQGAELPVLTEMRSPTTSSVRSLEEIAYGDLDLSAEDSVFEDSSADTAYHTSEVSTLPARMLAEE